MKFALEQVHIKGINADARFAEPLGIHIIFLNHELHNVEKTFNTTGRHIYVNMCFTLNWLEHMFMNLASIFVYSSFYPLMIYSILY